MIWRPYALLLLVPSSWAAPVDTAPTSRPDVAPDAIYDLREPGYPAVRILRWTDPDTGAVCWLVHPPTGSDSIACVARAMPVP